MDAIVAILQDEVTKLTNLNKDAENNILVSVAGLKQVCVGVWFIFHYGCILDSWCIPYTSCAYMCVSCVLGHALQPPLPPLHSNPIVTSSLSLQIRDLLLNKIPFSSDLCNWATEKEQFSESIHTWTPPPSDASVQQDVQSDDVMHSGDSAPRNSSKEGKEEITLSPVVPNNGHPLASDGSGVAGSLSNEWYEVQSHPMSA